MTHSLKLLLACGLALLAAWANRKYLEEHVRTDNYLVVNTRVTRGQKLTADKLSSVALGGQTRDLLRLTIPFRERATVEDREAPRDLEAGELLRRVDFDTPTRKPMQLRKSEMALSVPLHNLNVDISALRVGQWVYFSIAPEAERRADLPGGEPAQPVLKNVGPFRILAIGQHTDEDYQATAIGPNGETKLTVAGRLGPDGKGFDERTNQLFLAINSPQGGKVRAILPENTIGRGERPARPERGATRLPEAPAQATSPPRN